MEPFRSHRGSQTAFLLTGCILSCLLQLVPAQGNLTVVSIPEYPIQEQRVLLNIQNVQKEFEQCEWTQPSGETIIYTRTKITPTSIPQIVQVYENCSLSIKNLRLLDKGKYTVKMIFPSAQQQDTKGPEIYTGSIFVTFCDEKQLRIRIQPPKSLPGQNATLIAEGIQNKDFFCQWKQITQSGEKDIQDIKQDSKKPQTQQQKIIPDGCSLHLIQLIPDYSHSYSVYANIPSDQQSAKEKGTGEQGTCYRSQIQFQVGKSGSASVKYSAGIIAGALLGSLSWTSSLSLLPLFFGVLSSFFPEC